LYFSSLAIGVSGLLLAFLSAVVLQHQGFGSLTGIAIIVACPTACRRLIAEADRYLITNPTITQASTATTTSPANTSKKRLQLSLDQGASFGSTFAEIPHRERPSPCRVTANAS
jgi:hypothetical protein